MTPPLGSTLTNLHLTEKLIIKWLDERGAVGLTYLDVSKAFDSGNDRPLKAKLRGYGTAPIVISWVE